MPITLTEGRVTFTFRSDTRARSWDRSAAFRLGLGTVATTKAVDVAWWTSNSAVLLEVTNYNDSAPASIEELAHECFEKFRDTIASMSWAIRRAIGEESDHSRFAGRFVDAGRCEKITCAVWYEADVSPTREEALFLENAIRNLMRPSLEARIVVTNRALFPIDGVVATRLDGLEAFATT